MMVCNSLALKLAKITRETPDPPGGVIVRGAGRRADRGPEGRRDGRDLEGPARRGRRPSCSRPCARP